MTRSEKKRSLTEFCDWFESKDIDSRFRRLEWMRKKTSYRYTLNPIYSKTFSMEY